MRQAEGCVERVRAVAVYQNHDLDAPEVAHRPFVSFGSQRAMPEVTEPPERLPDFGGVSTDVMA
jgi:hypothetical protein